MEVAGMIEDPLPSNGHAEVSELTAAENELYDRQIRLWGLESQKRLSKAKILISGLNGLGAEVAKNIILAGVHSVALHDVKDVTEEDFCSQFLVPRTSIGENRAMRSATRAQALNPNVNLWVDTNPLSTKDGTYFAGFDAVVLIGVANEELLRINNICREKGVKFFAGDVWGTFGWCFADLQKHSFVEDVAKHKVVSKPNEKTKTELVLTTVQRELEFPPYSAVLDFDINSSAFQKKLKRTGPCFVVLRILQKFREKHGRDPDYKLRENDIVELQRIRDELTTDAVVSNTVFENLFGQISPAAAAIGGVLAQEVIKTVSKKEAPHRNVFLFDSENAVGYVETFESST